LEALAAGEDVEATAIGHFRTTGRLRLFYEEQGVADLDMHFLHDGRPSVLRHARDTPQQEARANKFTMAAPAPRDYTQNLLAILSSYNVCSKEWIIRQYDHEVQGTSVIKPLVGICNDGPGDAAVIVPVLGSHAGLALGCGINPNYGDLDPYWMAAAAV